MSILKLTIMIPNESDIISVDDTKLLDEKNMGVDGLFPRPVFGEWRDKVTDNLYLFSDLQQKSGVKWWESEISTIKVGGVFGEIKNTFASKG